MRNTARWKTVSQGTFFIAAPLNTQVLVELLRVVETDRGRSGPDTEVEDDDSKEPCLLSGGTSGLKRRTWTKPSLTADAV